MKKATNAKILDSAETLFRRGGYGASSLDKIANDAGQSKGALFHYFKSKKDITSQVLQKYAQKSIFEPLDRHFASTHKTKDALRSWAMEVYQGYADEEYVGGCLLGNFALELSDADENVRQVMAKIFLDLENSLTNYLKDPARQGEMIMEPRQFARILVATHQGMSMTIKVHKDRNRAGREFQAFMEMIDHLIKD
ncbi:MAG: TetR/AcrR family transcriptional regulator [Pseudomonadota bacterium]